MKKSNQSKSSFNWKKKLCCTLLVCALSLTCGAAVSCAPNNNDSGNSSTGDVVENVKIDVGEYYYDAEGVEHLLTIKAEQQYVYVAGEVRYEGAYTVSGNTVTFANSPMTAEVENGVIVLTVNDTAIRLLKKVNYTVNFTSNGASLQTVSVLNGKKVGKPADPELEGYQFIGWYTDTAFEKAFRFDSHIVTSNVTLYARWVESNEGGYEYAVAFDLNYEGAGEAPANVETIGGKVYDVNLPAEPTREGYEFKGWWVSMYGDATKLAYQYTEEVTLDKDTTLYALWASTEKTTKLAAPIVHIANNKLTWAGVENVSRYAVKVTGPDGFTAVNEKITKTEYDLDLTAAPTGDYVITVTAEAAVTSNNSVATVLYYKNKALTAVTRFDVVGESTLKFNPVANAEKYFISINCGNPEHNHVDIDNGASTTYDFGNCEMLSDGIVFTIKAVANGYTMSVSEEYVLIRNLDAVTGLTVNENETVSWNAVAGAEQYAVTIKTATKTETFFVDETSFDLKNYDAVGLRIEVYPYARGYNSPAPKSIRYDKESISAPKTPTLSGSTISWTEVTGATGYIVKIGDNTYETKTNSLELVKDTHYVDGQESCDISVLAVGLTENKNSEYSDIVTVRFGTITADAVAYVKGELTWTSVINVQKYEVKVNDNEAVEVDATETKQAVTLDKEGVNTVSIRSYNASGVASDWINVEVTAYEVAFDTDGGEKVGVQYKAAGDPITLPESYRSGYELVGWYDAPNGATTGATKYVENATFAGGNTTIYACWKGRQYTLVYDYAGKEVPENAPVAGSATYAQGFKLDAPVSTEGDVAFIGWFSEPNGAGTQYTDKEGNSVVEWTTPSDVKVYAYWATIFKFTVNPADGTYNVAMGPDLRLTKSITEITIPATYKGVQVRTVESYAFDNCTYLKKINIPDTIEVIETDTAFYRCKNLQGVEIYHVEGNNGEKLWSDTDGVLIYKDNTTGYMTLAFVPFSKTGEFVIPAGVTEVPLKAFANSLLSKITIPATVAVIRESAFYNCQNLTEVDFEASDDPSALLQLEAKAFEKCTKLETVTLPAHLTDVSVNIFSGCDALSAINMAYGSLIYTSKDGVLCEENGTKLVICPVGRRGDFVIPSGVFTIGAGAFAGCNKITKVTIPAVVTTIEEGAFRDLKALTKVEFKGGAITPQTIGDYAFFGCEDLATVEFGDNCYIQSLGKYAFAETAIRKLLIPAKMATVGDYAFADCEYLGTVTFADNGVDIGFGSYVFQNCLGLTEVNLPASVTSLQLAVFDGCNNLANVFVDDTSEHFMDKAGVVFTKDETELVFYPVGRKGNYVIPEVVTTIRGSVFKNNVNITGIEIGKNIKAIGVNAFDGCTNLAEVIISEEGDTLALGAYAFANCIRLGDITLPARITAISDYAFYGSSAITKIDIQGEVQSIGQYAFANTGLKELDLPETVTTLGNYAFSGSDVTNIVIPKTITSLGTHVFYGCKSLKNVSFAEGYTGTTIPNYAFAESTLETITIPASVTKLDNYAFQNAVRLNTIEFAEGSKLKTIGTYVFQNDSALTSIALPDTVTSVGNYAFDSCTALTTVTLNKTSKLATIGTYAFRYTALTYFYVPAKVKTISQQAFGYCRDLTTIEFDQEGTTALTLGKQAFYYSGVTQLDLPARLTTLTSVKVNNEAGYIDDVFAYAKNLTAINIAEGCANYCSVDGIVYSKDKSSIWVCPEGKAGAIIIPNTVRVVRSKAFNGCSLITSVTFEELTEGMEGTLVLGTPGDTSQGKAFYECLTLETVVLPQHLVTIDRNAFGYCVVLENIVIPASVETLGYSAFGYSGIKNITFETYKDGSRALKTWGQRAFQQCASLEEIVVPKEITILDSYLFGFSNNFKKVTFEEGSQLETIGSSVFSSTNLQELELPEGLKYFTYKYGLSVDTVKSITIPASMEDVANLLARNGFENIYVAEDHPIYKSVDGVVFEKETGRLAYFPLGRTGHYAIPDGTTIVPTELFQMSSITSLYVPASVVEFGENPFWYSSLESITFEEGTENLKMPNAFYGAYYLKEVTIPKRVTELGPQAFYQAESLEKVVFEEGSRIIELGDKAFQGCVALKEVVLPAGLTAMGASFQGCESLTSLVLPDGIIDIPANAFKNCTALTSITLPKNLVTIGNNAFENCGLTAVEIPGTLTALGAAAFKGNTALANVTLGKGCSITEIGADTFAGCPITSLTLPDTVTSIGANAFGSVTKTVDGESVTYYCSNLTNINIPSAVTAIGANAFDGAVKMKDVVLPQGLVELGDYAFRNCASLTNVTVPGTVKDLGAYVFSGCTGITSLTLQEGISSLGDGAFENCSSITNLYIPGSIVIVGLNPFNGCSSIIASELDQGNVSFVLEDNVLYDLEKSIIYAYFADGSEEFVIPEGVTQIAEGAFANTSITSIKFNNEVREISKRAFAGATKLVNVTLSDSVATIGESAFADCTALKTIQLPEKLRTIAANAFQNSGLTEVHIGAYVTTIGNYAFDGCTDLAKVTFDMTGMEMLPLGNYAFHNCTALTEITLPRRVSTYFYLSKPTSTKYSTQVAIGQYCFSGCTNLASVTFDETGTKKQGPFTFSITLGNYAFENCKALKTIAFPEYFGFINTTDPKKPTSTPTDIGTGAFKGCTNLTGLTFVDASFTKMGSNVFEDCTSLQKFDIPDCVTSVGTYVFNNCTSLTEVTLSPRMTTIGAYMFANTKITSIELPKKITSLGSHAFYNCTELKSIVVPGQVTTINDYVFANCTSLESVELPLGLKQMGKFSSGAVQDTWGYIFENCTAIKEITIPYTVTSLQTGNFKGWTKDQVIKVSKLKGAPAGWLWDEGNWDLDCEATVIWGV